MMKRCALISQACRVLRAGSAARRHPLPPVPQIHLFNQPLAHWDVSKVTSMRFMFYTNGGGGRSYFNQPLASWNVSRVVDMYGMFRVRCWDLAFASSLRLRRQFHFPQASRRRVLISMGFSMAGISRA